jgi:hypothetical protein
VGVVTVTGDAVPDVLRRDVSMEFESVIEGQDPRNPSEPEPRLAPVVPERATGGAGAASLLGSSWLRVGIVALLMLVLAVPVAMAMNRRDASTPAFAPGASAAPQASTKPDADPDESEPDNAGGPKNKAPNDAAGRAVPPGLSRKGAAGRPGAAGAVKGPITITAIDGSNVSLATEDGWSRSVTVTPTTTITKGGQTVALSVLQVGDEVRIRQTRNADGSYTITAIVVPGPETGGEVTAISGDKITVKNKDGSTRDITVTSSTTYKLGPNGASKSDVKVGSKIIAEGTQIGDTFTATTIEIGLAHSGGVVTSKTGDSITVEQPPGTKTVIHVSGSTTYKAKGNMTASLADVTVGARVQAHGTANADGSLDALTVRIGLAKGPKDHPAKPNKAPNDPAKPDAAP